MSLTKEELQRVINHCEGLIKDNAISTTLAQVQLAWAQAEMKKITVTKIEAKK